VADGVFARRPDGGFFVKIGFAGNSKNAFGRLAAS
jgi:hypothetical protein